MATSSSFIWSVGMQRWKPDLGTKRRVETTGQGEPGTIPTPLAQPGRPIPYLVGRQRVFQPNVPWMGNFRAILEEERNVETVVETERGPTGIGNVEVTREVVTTKYNTVGYHLSIMFSICLGPGVVLKAIGVGDTELWTGTAGPTRTEFTIAENNSYMSGEAIFAGGNFDQDIDEFLVEFHPYGMLPAYRGVAYIIIKDLRVDQLGSSYPWFEVERFPNPLGLASNINRIGDDLNTASAAADYIGTEWGGAGAGEDLIDVTTFSAAAATLEDENNAVSFQLTEETTASSIIGALMHQADGLIYENPQTGLVEFRLSRRARIDPLTAVKLTANITPRITRYSRQAWPSTINKLRVSFTRRSTGYKLGNIFGYTFNAITDRFKANRGASMDFPLTHEVILAKGLLARELGKLGTPLVAGEFETNRVITGVLPGDGAQILIPERVAPVNGIITRVKRFALTENRMIVGFEEVPPQNNNVVFDAETGLGDSFQITPVVPTAATIKQAPFWLARRAGLITALNETPIIAPLFLVTPADELQATFDVWNTNKPGLPAGSYARVTQGAAYPSIGTLVDAIGQFDAMDTGIIASLEVEGISNTTFMRSEGEEGVTEGRTLLLIDDEILSFETATENVITGVWTLTNVHRALLDTAPQAHAADATIYVMGNNYGVVGAAFSYPVSYTPNFLVTSNTAFAAQSPANSPLITTTWDKTFNRTRVPLRPHDAKINGADRSDSLENIFGEVGVVLLREEVFSASWRTRNRATLDVSVQLDVAEEAEIDKNGDYQLHRVMIRDSGSTLRDCGATADDATYNSLAAAQVPLATALGRGDLFVRAESIYGNSTYEDRIPVFIMQTDYFVSEDETEFFLGENDTDLYVME